MPEMDKRGPGKEKTDGFSVHAGWDEPIARYLEVLLLENLRMIFKSAIKEISESGYDELVSEKSILRRGLYIGSRNPVSTIVSDSLDFLMGKRITTSTEENFDGMENLVEYTLLEMTSVLREVRPFLSAGEAMWWLLICDLNVIQACRLEEDCSSGSSCSGGFSESQSSESALSQLRIDAQTHMTDSATFGEFLRSFKPNNPEGLNGDFSLAGMLRNLDTFLGTGGENGKMKSQASASGPNNGACRKVQLKRETTRHSSKTYSSGRNYISHGSKGLVRSGKLANATSILIDSKQKSSGSSKSPRIGSSLKSPGEAKTSPQPSAATKVSPKGPSGVKPNSRGSSEYYAGIPYDKALGKYLPRDSKDEIVLKLVPRLEGLQKELQGWTEWANQKVMQAARKLSKVQPELKTMRQLADAAKNFVEENNTRKLAIIENSVNGLDSLTEKGRAIISELEARNSLLKKELELAKSLALDSAASYKEALERMQKTQKDAQSWEGQNGLLYKELEAEKKKLAELQQELDKAKKSHLKLEARLERERKETEKLLTEAASIKKKREQLELEAKAEAESIKHSAETATQKSMEDIGKLESRYSKAMLKSDSSRIAAMKSGLASESFAKRLVEAKRSCLTTTGFRNFKDLFGSESLRQERECVMCLSEEMSVVFVPCSHQVLCEKCNELHEKRGMKDCPSCRTPIQRRVKVCFAFR